MVHAGRIDEVNAYCLCDVAQTAAHLPPRASSFRGVLRRPNTGRLARKMLSFLDKDPRVVPVMSATNRARFLLEESAA